MPRIAGIFSICSLLVLAFSGELCSQDTTSGEVAREQAISKNRIADVLQHAEFVSSYDGTSQPYYYDLPEKQEGASASAPVLIFLHSWSADYKQFRPEWVNAARQRNWIFLQPNFRGPNNRSEAGGSPAARQDILDIANLAVKQYGGDPERIYLAGVSGGGHMAMLMAGRHPERFSAVSAWVGISDLAEWYRFHTKNGKEGNYARMVSALCGGGPENSTEVDFQYRERSPLFWAGQTGDLPVDIAAGVHDGKTGSVPVSHSILYFNQIARAQKSTEVTAEEIRELWENSALQAPAPSDTAEDASYGRELKLRRFAGPSRLTIFEGGHEGLTEAACVWLEQQRRPTRMVAVEK